MFCQVGNTYFFPQRQVNIESPHLGPTGNQELGFEIWRLP